MPRMASGNLFGSESVEAPTRQRAGEVIHAHCDGGARGNPGPAGYGAVITAADGSKLAELSEFLGNRTNNYAEYSGLLGVLAWGLEHGYRSVRVVSDSELMVKQIQGKYKVNSPDLRALFDEAKKRIAKLDSFQITHALRHKNKDADRLANEAMDRGTGRSRPQETVRPSTPEKPISRAEPRTTEPAAAPAKSAEPASGQMLRGFVRGGVIHLLGGHTLPEGKFVKVVTE